MMRWFSSSCAGDAGDFVVASQRRKAAQALPRAKREANLSLSRSLSLSLSLALCVCVYIYIYISYLVSHTEFCIPNINSLASH